MNMKARVTKSSGSFDKPSVKKADIQKIIKNPNFENELCDSSTLLRIDQTELEYELEKVKGKIKLYEENIRDYNLQTDSLSYAFVGYANIKKKAEEEKYLAKLANAKTATKPIIFKPSTESKQTELTKPNKDDDKKDNKSHLKTTNNYMDNQGGRKKTAENPPEQEYDLELLKKNTYLAVSNGRIDEAENLLDMPGADINMTWFSENLLMCAIRNNREKMAEYLIKRGIDVNLETELVEFKSTKKTFTYVNYKCRDMAYAHNMHTIVNLIDIFAKDTERRIVKYLGNNYVKRTKKQKELRISRVPSPVNGVSYYEKRIKFFENIKANSDQNAGGALEVSQMPETDTNISKPLMTRSELMNFLDEIDQTKPSSEFNEETYSKSEMSNKKEEIFTKLNNELDNDNMNISSLIQRDLGKNDLTQLIMDKINLGENLRFNELMTDKSKRKFNKKVLNYSEYTVDMIVKDTSSTESTKSDKQYNDKLSPNSAKSSENKKLRPIESSTSNYDINPDKKCEIVDVHDKMIKYANNIQFRMHMTPRSLEKKQKQKTSGKLINIPHIIPLHSIPPFNNRNKIIFAKKSSTDGAAFNIKGDPDAKHLTKLNTYYYLNDLSIRNKRNASAKSFLEELKSNEKATPLFPIYSNISNYRPVDKSHSAEKFVGEETMENNVTSKVNNDRLSLLACAKSVKTMPKPMPYKTEEAILNTYLDSLKQAGLYNKNSRPIIKNSMLLDKINFPRLNNALVKKKHVFN